MSAPPSISAVEPRDLGALLPSFLRDTSFLAVDTWQWLGLLVAVLLAVLVAFLANAVLIRLFLGVARRTSASWDDLLVSRSRAPVRFLLALLAFDLLIRPLDLATSPAVTLDVIRHTLLLVGFTWLVLRMLSFSASTLEERFAGPGADPGIARGVRTQVRVMHRVAQVVLLVVAGALVLMQFEVVRSVGVSLLASAGVAGIVLGLAAQKTIGSVLAGIQLSITQPVRIGDTVIVEGEWGIVEEIHLTYAVVSVWDQRRLIVPVGHFLDQPFQNWTKVAPQLLGTVEIFADYSVPVGRVRAELERLVRESKLWDGRAWGLQVTNASERTVTLRALISAASAGDAWNLRCEVREQLIAFLQQLEDGRYLPRIRVDGDRLGAVAERGAA